MPALVKGPLERLASEQLGRTVTVGSLDFKPWSLELTLRDITVAGAKGAEGQAQLTIGRVYVDAELQSLLRPAPGVVLSPKHIYRCRRRLRWRRRWSQES